MTSMSNGWNYTLSLRIFDFRAFFPPFRSLQYTCLVCNLFDDEDKDQYHCDGCGICRIGGRNNFFHCEVCNMCLPQQLKTNGHRVSIPLCVSYQYWMFQSILFCRAVFCFCVSCLWLKMNLRFYSVWRMYHVRIALYAWEIYTHLVIRVTFRIAVICCTRHASTNW